MIDSIFQRSAPEGLESVIRKIEAGERIAPDEALALYEHAPLALLGGLAVQVKERKSGRDVFYNRNFHVEPSNICIFNCRFCSYRQPAHSPGAWDRPLEEIFETCHAYQGRGVTEVHVVGGVHPDHGLDYYVRMIEGIKRELPDVIVKAFSAVELHEMIRRAGVSLENGLQRLKTAGMAAIPGGGAEIFDEEVRQKICPEKCTTDEWLSLHRTAHRLGISSNATMLYGHIETQAQRIDHLDRLRRSQDETGGFNAFIPLKFRRRNNALSELGETSITDDLRTLALSRIYLDNFPHIKAYWPMYGKTTTQLALAFGADDIDGTIDDTTRIYSMAGADDRNPALTVDEMRRWIEAAGYRAVERDTFYRPVVTK
ncbi:MAG: aminofutalosine synthase MqnE [Rikenellaceae bacterium]|jgi:aminodeoxyfutalosine synthase|nr:aminofutalosine synthase MqnE [Rikenellaceae bacterium]